MTARTDALAPKPRFAILASGRGSNADALISAFQRGTIPGQLVLVFCNVPDAGVIGIARARGVPCEVVPSRDRDRAQHEAELLACLLRHRVEHLLLAGYMRILSTEFLRRFSGAILNIHPSLLPDFPGLGAVQRQWDAGVRTVGATVHFVDSGIDTGPVLLQAAITVRGDEGPEGLAARIRTEVEHAIYPRAVKLLCEMLARLQKEGRDAVPGPR